MMLCPSVVRVVSAAQISKVDVVPGHFCDSLVSGWKMAVLCFSCIMEVVGWLVVVCCFVVVVVEKRERLESRGKDGDSWRWDGAYQKWVEIIPEEKAPHKVG